MSPLRILIADDHPMFRAGARALMEAAPENEVVGEATTGDEAVRMAETLQPDVVLMDLRMPGLNGIEATRQIVATSPHIRVLMVTMFEDAESIFAALRAGALGYVLKDANKTELMRAVQAVGNGEGIFSAGVAGRLASFFSSPHPLIPRTAFPELTEREREVLDLIAQGATNLIIAQRLTLSGKTVSNYVSNILSKLQVVGRAEAVIRAREAGMGIRTDRDTFR